MTNEQGQAPGIQLDANVIINDLLEQNNRLAREKATQVAITKAMQGTVEQVVQAAQTFEQANKALQEENQMLHNEVAQLKGAAKKPKRGRQQTSQQNKENDTTRETPAQEVEAK